MTIGELAEAVGITQPGATRSVAQLARVQMVKVTHGREDQRQRLVALTPRGREQVERGRREVWPQIEAAVADLCAGLNGPLLRQLAAIEDGLAERPLDRRVAKPLRRRT
jgi:DNA-binding MarR family transcriptional regulator